MAKYESRCEFYTTCNTLANNPVLFREIRKQYCFSDNYTECPEELKI